MCQKTFSMEPIVAEVGAAVEEGEDSLQCPNIIIIVVLFISQQPSEVLNGTSLHCDPHRGGLGWEQMCDPHRALWLTKDLNLNITILGPAF